MSFSKTAKAILIRMTILLGTVRWEFPVVKEVSAKHPEKYLIQFLQVCNAFIL